MVDTLGVIVVPALALLFYRVIELREDRDEDDFGEPSASEPEPKTTPASEPEPKTTPAPQRDTLPYRDTRPEFVVSFAPLIALGVVGFAVIFILSKHR